MANIRRTAMGDAIDMDMVRLANENTIAIGNARTNARGDQLGAGGKVIKTRAQIMQEYHKLNTPVVSHDVEIKESAAPAPSADFTLTNLPQAIEPDEATLPTYVKPRGSFADAVSAEASISQELLTPANSTGIKRI